MRSVARPLVWVAIIVVVAVVIGYLSAAQKERGAGGAGHIARVPEITDLKHDVQESAPPNLVITATGVVPTGGWTEITLLPRETARPPADGIYEFDLLAVRPSGPAIQVLTKVQASYTWKAYPANEVRGIRVYGSGQGVKTAMLVRDK